MHGSVSPIDCMIFLVGKMALCVDGYEIGWSQEVTECLPKSHYFAAHVLWYKCLTVCT